MKVAIIALILSAIAASLGGFATFKTVSDESRAATAPVATESSWSQEDCDTLKAGQTDARDSCSLPSGPFGPGDCSDFISITEALNEHCP